MNHLPNHSRTWVYTSERALTTAEAVYAQQAAAAFCQTWNAHGNPLASAAAVLDNHFLILAVDEEQAGASGCSIDKSVRFIKDLGIELGVDFLARSHFFIEQGKEALPVAIRDVKQSIEKGLIKPETGVYDTLVPTLGQLRTAFVKPALQTWLKRYFIPASV